MLIFTLGLRGMWRRAMSLLYSHVDFTPQDKHSHTHFITTEQTFAHVNTLVETCTCHDTHLHTFPERRPTIANRDERLRQRALCFLYHKAGTLSARCLSGLIRGRFSSKDQMCVNGSPANQSTSRKTEPLLLHEPDMDALTIVSVTNELMCDWFL